MFKKYQLINIARTELGMDDDSYRAMVNRINGGKGESLKDCNMADLNKILTEMKEKGFKVKPVKPGGFKSRRAKPATNNDGKPIPADIRDKMLSLWIEMSEQGIVRDGSDKALAAYCKNRTEADHWHWISMGEASEIIEGLKTWQSRELLNRLLKKLTSSHGVHISKSSIDLIADLKRAKTMFKYTSTENWRVINYLCDKYDIDI